MNKYVKNRIYKFLSEPMTILGLTIDELGILLFTVYYSGNIDDLIVKLLFIGLMIGFVLLLKRAKNLISGFSLKAFLHWYLGILLAEKQTELPHSSKKRWIV